QENPALVEELLSRRALSLRQNVANAQQHRAESMKELLLAEEQEEKDLNERGAKLQALREAKKAAREVNRKALAIADAKADSDYDQGAAALVEEGNQAAKKIATLKKVTESCQETVRALAAEQGFAKEDWEVTATKSVPKDQAHTKARTAADVVRGIGRAGPDVEDGRAERERQAQHAANLRELEKRSRPLKVAMPMGSFFEPEARRFKELTKDEEDHADAVFGKPAEHITFQGLAIIALRGKAEMFDDTLGAIRKKLVSAIHESMTLLNMSRVNSETMELVIAAEHYPHMCMYLSRIGKVLATPGPCYRTGHSDISMEPTPMSTLTRWSKETRAAKNLEGRAWYTAAIAQHADSLRTEARRRQYTAIVADKRRAETTTTVSQADENGFQMPNKRGQSTRTSNFSDSAEARQQAIATQNKYMALDMDTTEDSNDNSTNDSNSDLLNSNDVGSPSRAPGGQSSF
ncbi:hypothetical protein LPJ71_005584, partial [Coemansia sp. S17]